MSDQVALAKPKRNCKWVDEDNQLTVVLIPKFGNHALGRWLMAKMKKPYYRLKLDEIGSFVWHRCDGDKTVEQIGSELSNEFGSKIEPVQGRLQHFLNSLTRSKSITWQ